MTKSIDTRIRIEPANWASLAEGDVMKRLHRAHRKFGEEVVDEIKGSSPVGEGNDGGHYRDAWTLEGNDFKLRAVNDKPYASIIRDGRGEVRPVNKRVLRFEINGETIFAHSSAPVDANPHAEDSAEDATRRAQAIYTRNF